jgi:Fe-S oxidoreductase
VELGAEILVTACPLCVLTLEDAAKTSGFEEKLKVMDVTELLAEAME